jgi:hypothetical protein
MKANSRGLGEQRLDDRQDCQLSATALRNRRCPQKRLSGLFGEVNGTQY